MNSEATKMFNEVFSRGKKVLVPYLTAGVPSMDESLRLATAMIESGAGILELGVPFSDPSADGVVLQQAAEVALKNKVTLSDVLGLARKIHDRHPQVPIVLFTYLNPILAMGMEKYVELAREHGVAATLTVDLPLEEAFEYLRLHQTLGLKTVFLASPTTSDERLKEINRASSAFLYYVSRTGVTGERAGLSSSLDREIAAIRDKVNGPLAIGFGISTTEQAKMVAQLGDAVVIGSAYMRMIMEHEDSDERERVVKEFTRECVLAMD